MCFGLGFEVVERLREGQGRPAGVRAHLRPLHGGPFEPHDLLCVDATELLDSNSLRLRQPRRYEIDVDETVRFQLHNLHRPLEAGHGVNDDEPEQHGVERADDRQQVAGGIMPLTQRFMRKQPPCQFDDGQRHENGTTDDRDAVPATRVVHGRPGVPVTRFG